MRELKKQLAIEKKRAEKLAEKIKTVDSTLIETNDHHHQRGGVGGNGNGSMLSVPKGHNRDETSSIGSWSLPTGTFI